MDTVIAPLCTWKKSLLMYRDSIHSAGGQKSSRNKGREPCPEADINFSYVKRQHSDWSAEPTRNRYQYLCVTCWESCQQPKHFLVLEMRSGERENFLDATRNMQSI